MNNYEIKFLNEDSNVITISTIDTMPIHFTIEFYKDNDDFYTFSINIEKLFENNMMTLDVSKQKLIDFFNNVLNNIDDTLIFNDNGDYISLINNKLSLNEYDEMAQYIMNISINENVRIAIRNFLEH